MDAHIKIDHACVYNDVCDSKGLAEVILLSNRNNKQFAKITACMASIWRRPLVEVHKTE